MANGFAGKVLFVDLTRGTFEDVALEEKLYRDYVGGYGLGVRILFERIKADVDPLGPDNMIGFMAGPLVGTNAPLGGRFTVAAKSPLTGGWGDSCCGGTFANGLKSTGYDGVFFTGKSEKPVYLFLTHEHKELKNAAHLWGKNTEETQNIIKEELNDKRIAIACIGQAGENLSRISSIMNDYGRAAGRSGLGAVMGSKNLKALAARGTYVPSIADMDAFNAIVSNLRAEAKTDIGELLNNLGTSGVYSGTIAGGAAPVKNWKGVSEENYSMENASKVAGEAYEKYKKRNYACMQCTLACGTIIEFKDPENNALFSDKKPEYETIAAFGSMCLVHDIETIIKANKLCNLHGLDTISAGTVVAFAMECYERGIITKQDTGGFAIEWSNGNAVLNLLELIATRKGIGKLLADGVKMAAERIGKHSEEFAMHVGGQEVPMQDPRCSPGFGYTYEFDPTPGRHTQSAMGMLDFGLDEFGLDPSYKLAELGGHKYDYKAKGKGRALALLSNWYHYMNLTGLCFFALISYKKYPLVELIRSVTGWKDYFEQEALATGERVNALRQCFNLREGVELNSFRLPKRVLGVPPLSAGPTKSITVDIDVVREGFLREMDWDLVTGRPSDKKLAQLGLQELVSH